ncbi:MULTISPECIES: hypothetical protein [unclassified Staphylococcus]|uniref:hypothetical protein n=1 Tax=unclassified Staphylococcus TaxID=91994 RepID=UPI0021D2F442|nr:MULTISPECIES: hypothetical protein [unclassified Staphylococcus]UXR72131.1 hypothetical protein MUA88_02800 [Staphylococcus sp. IVB6240]UXR74439.1 hypothetical protein MUA48_02980 [Staphylococcus sp. IVB6238]UXR76824.1 hypothetical protein MUA74_03340 [Staphylococcus sp. IVB6233]
MLYIKSKFLLILAILLFISMFYFKTELRDSILRLLGYILSGVLAGKAIGYKEKGE